ncbi:hypothetical protein G3570_09120 [Balneolaceae bacterium YR4-1]|uniref:HTTM domain-containing protein n=1 Tax=Halalkalibaculum roseum TaxID=2709311 RepID=A0A6M1SVD1_9BACT|nr:hypothetical protein [Halalkalibaculum roseum]NGP76792.1 hypothetical protein [Halalkalibaculum roseum]
MNSLLQNLFEFKRPDSIGVKLYLRLFELFSVCYTLIYAWDWGFYILRISDVVLPLGLANYIDVEIFFGNSLPLISAGLISGLAVVAFFSRRYKWLYILIFLLLHLQYVTRFSLGEIPHSSNLIGFSILGLGLAFCFINNRWKALSFAYGFLVFFVGLSYTSASISKLVASGISWVDGNHLWLWIAEKSTDVLSAEGSYTLTWVQELALQSRLIATIILIIGLVTEICAFLFWWKRLRPYITLLLIGMHIGIYYSMNIWFMSYLIELSIIGFPWYKLFNYLDEKYNLQNRNNLLKYL